MKEECVICKKPLVYLEADELMECAICHKREASKTRCREGHYGAMPGRKGKRPGLFD